MDELCSLFHQQALCSPSGLLFQRVGRSEAAARLRRNGRRSLPDIVAFIERRQSDPEFDYSDMRGVWHYLLSQIKSDIDPNSPAIPFMETDAWLAWARAQSET